MVFEIHEKKITILCAKSYITWQWNLAGEEIERDSTLVGWHEND